MDHVLTNILVPEVDLTLPGYQVAFSYRPAWREAEVGGDFYNLFALGKERFGLVLGDVGGKGLEAATLAARLQPALRSLFVQPGATPASVLNQAHRFWVELTSERLVTLFVAALDAPRGELAYCSAGHEPALVCRNGGPERLKTQFPPLIPLPVEPYADSHLRLDPGDLLFVYTDGLPEAGLRGREGCLGLEAVEDLLRLQAHHPPEAILRSACRAAGLRAGGWLHDDIVMLALRRSKVTTDCALTFRRCRECPGMCGCDPPSHDRRDRSRAWSPGFSGKG